MSNTFVALIAAGAAILASVLTSYLTHLFERRRKAREYELGWLEERFGQAISFLGRVLSRVANTPNTPEDRASFASRIEDIVCLRCLFEKRLKAFFKGHVMIAIRSLSLALFSLSLALFSLLYIPLASFV